MGNNLSQSALADSNLDKNLISELNARIDALKDDRYSVEEERPEQPEKETSSDVSDFCPICLDFMDGSTRWEATKYHSNLRSLEKSVKAGCHLCSLVKHFLPERPRHQLDERLTLSLRWDTNWAGSLLAGWRHRVVFFNLLSLGEITKFQRAYYKELEEGPQSTVHIYKEFATSMLTHCINNHPRCQSLKDPSWSPTRLIEIEQTPNGPKLRLVTNQTLEPYTALSHCWGVAHVFKLLSGNLEEMKSEIDISQLPKTFQDAISITSWFNVRYIWIDSCCIIQDSVEDWLEESAMMDNVYKNAYCTIAADCAEDGNQGCIVKQKLLTIRPCVVYTDRGPILCLPPQSLLEQKFESEPLEQRAWALQERMLSPRILHCATDQLLWECNEEFKCQTYPDDLTANGDFQKVPRMITLFTDQAKLHQQWNGVVEDYCKRSLTRAEDKLIALSGIAKVFQSRMTNNTYLAGLWYNSLPHALLWKVVDPALVTRPISYRAPSWSWASLDSRIIPNNTEATMDTCQFCLEILGSHLDLVSEDLTGQVRGGYLQVRGLVKRVRGHKISQTLIPVEELLETNGKVQRLSKTTSISFSPDTSDIMLNLDSKELFCLIIKSQHSTMDGLVLCSTNEPDRFQRVGTFRATGEQACTAMKYNLRPSVQYGDEDLWESQIEDGFSFEAISNYKGRRANAMNIAHVPREHGHRKLRHLEVRADHTATPVWENTYDPIRNHGGLSKLINTDPQGSWDPDKSWTKINDSQNQRVNSGETSWNPSRQQQSYPSIGSRKSKSKAVHVEYQAKMTDPLSIYLLDPAHTQEHFERLTPRTIMLV